jgi:hypothetical protein
MRWRHPALVDAFAVLGLVLAAVTAFADTFDGWGFLGVAAVGAAAGIGSAALVIARGWPWWTLPGPMVVAALLLGPPAALRSAPSGPVPGVGATRALGELLVHGWKDLLTTLPPVDGAGRLSALPFFLALAAGAVGYLLATRSWRPFLPVVVPAALAVAVIALGVADVVGIFVRALALFAGAVVWGTVRRRRLQSTGRGGGRRRVLTGLALLTASAVLVGVAAPTITAPAASRTVLRDRVIVPVALSDQPSPLSSFRRFRPVSADLADQLLFTVTGVPAGTPVRLATVDRYAGSVWAAGTGARSGGLTDGSGFLRVGVRIPVTAPGTIVSAQFTIGAAYAAVPDLRVWLPDVGLVTKVAFDGPPAALREEDLRYNPSTGAALVVGGLAAGDTYRVDAVLPTVVLPARPGPVGPPTASAENTGPAPKYLALAAPAGANPIDQIRAVAERLRSTGAYTDGAGEESTFLPGHSVGRLTQFLGENSPAGNDEQYAAALAVCAAYVGLPSRVVVGAVPGSDGVVRGRDVRAWVEVQVDASTWWTITPDEFIPARDKHPVVRQPSPQDNTQAAVVPPPNALRPPSSVEGFSLDDSSSGRTREEVEAQRWVMPPWLVLALKIASVPIITVLAWTLLLVGAKASRRASRRRRGSPTHRVLGGWDEVIDTLRDAGAEVSTRQTRSEVGGAVPGLGLREVAGQVDLLAFGPTRPSEADAVNVWAQVARVRAQVAAGQSWRDRWRAAVSMRSVRESGPVLLLSPSSVQAGRVTHGVSAAGVPAGGSPAAPPPAAAAT